MRKVSRWGSKRVRVRLLIVASPLRVRVMGHGPGRLPPMRGLLLIPRYTRSASSVKRPSRGASSTLYCWPMARRKNPNAVALGRLGGKKGGRKGGKARCAGLSAEERSELMRRAVLARWRRGKKGEKASG